jgi:hypothetical protein
MSVAAPPIQNRPKHFRNGTTGWRHEMLKKIYTVAAAALLTLSTFNGAVEVMNASARNATTLVA